MSDRVSPVLCIWQGDSFTPASPRWQKEADKHLIVGERYLLTPEMERSDASHRHYFACIRDAWLNLPEDKAEQFRTEEVLRKHALIKAGYCDSHTLVCKSEADAERAAAFMRPIDEHSIVISKGAVVVRYVAKSQSKKAMGAEVFQASKQAVLDLISGLIGTTRAQLEGNNAA